MIQVEKTAREARCMFAGDSVLLVGCESGHQCLLCDGHSHRPSHLWAGFGPAAGVNHLLEGLLAPIEVLCLASPRHLAKLTSLFGNNPPLTPKFFFPSLVSLPTLPLLPSSSAL